MLTPLFPPLFSANASHYCDSKARKSTHRPSPWLSTLHTTTATTLLLLKSEHRLTFFLWMSPSRISASYFPILLNVFVQNVNRWLLRESVCKVSSLSAIKIELNLRSFISLWFNKVCIESGAKFIDEARVTLPSGTHFIPIRYSKLVTQTRKEWILLNRHISNDLNDISSQRP